MTRFSCTLEKITKIIGSTKLLKTGNLIPDYTIIDNWILNVLSHGLLEVPQFLPFKLIVFMIVFSSPSESNLYPIQKFNTVIKSSMCRLLVVKLTGSSDQDFGDYSNGKETAELNLLVYSFCFFYQESRKLILAKNYRRITHVKISCCE